MDKAFLPLSEEVLAATFNLSSEEFSTFFEEKDGEKSPIDEQKIRSKLLSKIGERIDGVVSEKSSSIEKEAEQKWKRLAFKEIEDRAKEELGIDMRWSDHGLSKIKDSLTKQQKKSEVVDVAKTEEFQAMVKSYEDKITELSSNHQQELANYKKETVTRSLSAELFSFFKGKENELAIPPNDEVLKKQINIMIERDLFNDQMSVDYVDGVPVIIDKDGKPAIDKSNGYNPYDFNNYITSVAKEGYFPELQTPKISSPNPAQGKVKVELGSDKSFNMPKFKDFEELGQFTQSVQSNKNYTAAEQSAIINEANKQIESLAV